MNGPKDPMIVRDVAAGGFCWVNRAFTQRLGWTAEDLVARSLTEWVAPEQQSALECVLASGKGQLPAMHIGDGGEPAPLEWEIRTEPHGLVALGVSPGCRTEQVPRGERQAGSKGSPAHVGDTLAETLETMALIIEDQHPGRRCSILLLDAGGTHVSVGAGPSLPKEYNGAVEGLMIGSSVGSCGTAAYWNQSVLVEDIQEESLWRDLKCYAAKAGVAACWSHPITARSGEVLGALALYSVEPGAPDHYELRGLAMSAQMVALAIERGRAELALRESEAEAKFQARLLSAVTEVVTSFVDKNDLETAAQRLLTTALDLTDSACGILGDVLTDRIDEAGDAAAIVAAHREQSLYRRTMREGGVATDLFDPFLGEVALRVEPLISNDPGAEDRFALQAEPGANVPKNFVGGPIRVDGRVVAILFVGNSSRAYGVQDANAMTLLCRAASVLFDAYRRQRREAALEDDLRQAAKMEAIGVLAGGIAHDFNNMLAAVQGNAELALELLPKSSEISSNLRSIVTASRRSSELCNQMLAYAGRGLRQMQSMDANVLIRELGALQQVTLSKKAALSYDLAPEPLYIEADAAQMNQVIMNLTTNGAEAIGDNEGSLRVSTSSQWMDRRQLDQLPGGGELDPGEFVRIEMADSGCGIGREMESKIYDPFYTTKASGRGLGLAAVRGIVRGHGGSIFFESDVGKGTTFTVLLPRADGAEAGGEGEQVVRVQNLSRQKRILVVDDEVSVRDIHASILERAGYEVVVASDGQEAVDLYEEQGDSIDCVLLDLSMPRLDGVEALQAMQANGREVRAVLTSGFHEQEMLDRFLAAGFAGVLQKPAPMHTILAMIDRVVA